jgi:hypothetical protein
LSESVEESGDGEGSPRHIETWMFTATDGRVVSGVEAVVNRSNHQYYFIQSTERNPYVIRPSRVGKCRPKAKILARGSLPGGSVRIALK